MSNRGWVIATLIMLALGVYFISNHHPRGEAAGLTISEEIERSNGDNEK
jgi:hypothetical protein